MRLRAAAALIITIGLAGCGASSSNKTVPAGTPVLTQSSSRGEYVAHADRICKKTNARLKANAGRYPQAGKSTLQTAARAAADHNAMLAAANELEALGVPPPPRSDQARAYIQATFKRAALFRLYQSAVQSGSKTAQRAVGLKLPRQTRIAGAAARAYGFKLCGGQAKPVS